MYTLDQRVATSVHLSPYRITVLTLKYSWHMHTNTQTVSLSLSDNLALKDTPTCSQLTLCVRIGLWYLSKASELRHYSATHSNCCMQWRQAKLQLSILLFSQADTLHWPKYIFHFPSERWHWHVWGTKLLLILLLSSPIGASNLHCLALQINRVYCMHSRGKLRPSILVLLHVLSH